MTPDTAREPDGDGPAGSALPQLSSAQGLPAPVERYLDMRDGTRIRFAHWPAAKGGRQGAVLCLNGRTEFIEKTMDVYGILHRSGLDVWTLDWRGQGRSSRALDDPDKGHVTDYQDYLDDLHTLIGAATDLGEKRGKTLMLGHSMGGHIGLRYLHDHPGLFDAAAFSAPMIDIAVNRAPLRALNAAIVGLGFGGAYALGMKPFRFIYANPDDPSDNGDADVYRTRIADFRILTHDAAKFMEIQRLIRADPTLALGGPTAAWLDATFRSINLTWSPGYAEAIDTPVLMIGGGRDQVVVTKRQKVMAKRLPRGAFQVIDRAAHELLVECDDVRAEFLTGVAAFAGIDLELPPLDMSGCVR